MGVGGFDFHLVVCSGLNGSVHGADEFGSAVRIDGVVAAMVGQHDGGEAVAVGDAGGYGEHDAVAEGHHGGFHVLFVVVAFGDGIGALEEGGTEIAGHEVEVDHNVGDVESIAMELGVGDFFFVVV